MYEHNLGHFKYTIYIAYICLHLAIFSHFILAVAINSSVDPSTFTDVTSSPIHINTDLGPCTCDLTAVACDVNCCCDADCNPADKLVFSQCDDLLHPVEDNSYMCKYSTAIYSSSSDVTTTEIVNPNLFCIWADRNIQRNYYRVTDLIKTSSDFNEFANEVSDVGYRYANSPSSSTPLTQSNYRSGDIILTLVSGDLNSALYVASTNGHTSSCLDTNPARFLTAQSTKCMRNFKTDLNTSCETTESLNAATFISRLSNIVSDNAHVISKLYRAYLLI